MTSEHAIPWQLRVAETAMRLALPWPNFVHQAVEYTIWRGISYSCWLTLTAIGDPVETQATATKEEAVS
jgi:hypothetical protein